MAYYKTNNCAIINGSATHKGKLAHEVGHCFYLYHTHGYGIEELVNGSNCEIAGDKLCDTPAEPYRNDNGIRNYVYENCNYFGTFRDSNNQLYNPDTYNIMSYTWWSCRQHFSTLQIQKMHQTLETYLSELISASVPLANKINGVVIPNIPNQPSTLTVVGGVTVNSGESTDLLDGNSYDIKTDQERFPNYQSYGTVKHNKWNSEASQFKLTENYTIERTNSPYRDAHFLSLNYAKIEAKLEGYLVDQKGYFEFKDP